MACCTCYVACCTSLGYLAMLTLTWSSDSFNCEEYYLGVLLISVREDPGEQAQCQREPIPERGPTNEKAQFCLVDVWGKRTMSTLRFYWAEQATTQRSPLQSRVLENIYNFTQTLFQSLWYDLSNRTSYVWVELHLMTDRVWGFNCVYVCASVCLRWHSML